jgi:hypothetical protein
MAKFLAYKRATRRVVTVNTVTPAVVDLGTNDIPLADTTNAFPNRCENIVGSFRGEYYVLYRSAANELRLSALDRGTGLWGDVAGFAPITTGTGGLTPVCLHASGDRFSIVGSVSNSAGVDGPVVRRSNVNDGTVWLPEVFLAGGVPSLGGASIVWHNAVWFTRSDGIGYYVPGTNVANWFDTGDDAAITGEKANFGAFTVWRGDLYYVLPSDTLTGSPFLYKLDKTWTTSSPVPTFEKQTIIIPTVGAITVANDTGNYALFANKLGELCLIYSGTTQTKLVRIEKTGATYNLSDLTDVMLTEDIRTEPSLGFGYYVDDRRSENESHTIIIRFRPSIPVAVLIASWDGVAPVEVLASLDDGGGGLDLIVPDEERSDFRTYTDNQPSCAIDSTSEPFPGRTRINYTVRDESSRPVDVIAQYSLDGQTWSNMTQGDGDSGIEDLTTSPLGQVHFFHWDAFNDLDGDQDSTDVRVVARISGT